MNSLGAETKAALTLTFGFLPKIAQKAIVQLSGVRPVRTSWLGCAIPPRVELARLSKSRTLFAELN
jgi:hypothetical protein